MNKKITRSEGSKDFGDHGLEGASESFTLRVEHPMAENPPPNPHDDIFAYLAWTEARIEALEAARAAQEALSAESRAGVLLTRLEAVLSVLGDMPKFKSGYTLQHWLGDLQEWRNKVCATVAKS